MIIKPILNNIIKTTLSTSIFIPLEMLENRVIIESYTSNKNNIAQCFFYFFTILNINNLYVSHFTNKYYIIIYCLTITFIKCIYKILMFKNSISEKNYKDYFLYTLFTVVLFNYFIRFNKNIYFFSNINNKFIKIMLANIICFPFKILSFKHGFYIKFNKKRIKNTIVIDILKTSIVDNILLVLK